MLQGDMQSSVPSCSASGALVAVPKAKTMVTEDRRRQMSFLLDYCERNGCLLRVIPNDSAKPELQLTALQSFVVVHLVIAGLHAHTLSPKDTHSNSPANAPANSLALTLALALTQDRTHTRTHARSHSHLRTHTHTQLAPRTLLPTAMANAAKRISRV